MSADEIKRLANKYESNGNVHCIGPKEENECFKALISFAAMVERCEERIAHYSREVEDCGQSCVEMGREEMTNRIMRSELNYILKGATK